MAPYTNTLAISNLPLRKPAFRTALPCIMLPQMETHLILILKRTIREVPGFVELSKEIVCDFEPMK